MLNMWIGVGNLARDVECMTAQSGTKIANLVLACDSGFGDHKHTEFARVVVFGKTAEFCEKYLTKGAIVQVQGVMKTKKWQDQSGQDRYSTEIIADRVQSIKAGGNASPSERPAEPRHQATTKNAARATPTLDESLDDDLPF